MKGEIFMYTERKDNFSIKNVILQFLFVALFIFVLIWLFPMKSDLKPATVNAGSETVDVSMFYDQIFNNNVIAMKDAAKGYYTTPRLPKNVGDKVSMTLGEMLEKKIILPFVDSKGKQCDLTDSYVEITKYDDEFVMKVNLKCSEQENYLLVYMGCYDYCSTSICEKNTADIKTPVIYPSNPAPAPEPTPIVTPPVVNNVTNITNNITNITNITNNIVNNNTVTIIQPEPEKPEPEEPTPTPTPTSPSCTLQVVSGDKSGNYYTGTVVVGFKSKTSGDNATVTGFGLGTSTNYNGDTKYTLTKPGTYTVYGYVKNSYGNTAVCSIDVDIQDPQVVKEYEYEYRKDTTTCSDYSNWSDWSTTYVEPTALRQVAYRNVKITSIVGYKTTTSNDISKPIYGTQEVAVGTLSETICTEYGYTATGTIAYSDWVDAGYVTTTSILKNTDLERYVPVTDTETLCQSYCSSVTGHVYKKYTRKVLNNVVYTCKNTTTVKKLVTAQETVITGYEQITTSEPITETKIEKQYRYRTKTCDTTTDKKWSYYNNTSLLNTGYTYTGEKRLKN